jgi:ketosteroid isomerase-like protein
MSNAATLDHDLNQAILSGKALEAFEKYYAEDIVMEEPGVEPHRGKDVNRKREQEFFNSVEEFHGAELIATAVEGDTSFSQWKWDVTLRGMGRILLEQVAVRTWRDDRVVYERFYYNKG